MAAIAESKFVKANGLRLHYLDYGGPAKPMLVCLHGRNGNAHAFDQIAPLLCETHHVISLDFRGHGDSQWGPPSEYIPANYLRDFIDFFPTLNVAQLSLIGSSLGGVVAMIFAATQPERVEKLRGSRRRC